jgi:hypothetical protein
LYVVKGDRLPTLTDYDFKQSTRHSEVMSIDSQNEYFINNDISNLEGIYIIGVYGNLNSTFTLTVHT